MGIQDRLHRLWHGETNGLTAAAVIVGAASMASRFVGVVRDRVLASTFGAGHDLDAYYAAFRVPDFLYTLIILGALSAGFIPVFAEYLETKGKDEAWRLAEQVLSVVGAFMAVACLLLAIFARQLVPLTVPGFSPEMTDVTVTLSRIMFLSPFLLGISAVMGGILQTLRRYLAFSLAPVFYNFGIIFGALVLAPRMGIVGVAWGVVIGALFHLLAQATVVLKLGIRRVSWPSLKPSGVRRILKLMVPRMIGLAVSQMNLVILLAFASALPAGSVAVFNLANNLQSFPVGIIGISFALAAFPLLSAAASTKDWGRFNGEFVSAAAKICFFILPATALFILLRIQIVRLVLGAGHFDWKDTITTANVLGFFTVSLLAQALVPLFARAFFAVQDTRTPLFISFLSEVLNLGLAYLLRGPLGIAGLSLAFSAASFFNAFFLWWTFTRKRGWIDNKKLGWSILKSGVAAVAIVGFGWPVRQLFGTLFPLRTYWQVALQGAAAGLVGVAAFILVAHLLKSEEMTEVRHALQRKLLHHKPQVAGAEEAQGF